MNSKQSPNYTQKHTQVIPQKHARLVTFATTLQPAFAHQLKIFQKIPKNSKKTPSRLKNAPFQRCIGTHFTGKSARNQNTFLRKQSQS